MESRRNFLKMAAFSIGTIAANCYPSFAATTDGTPTESNPFESVDLSIQEEVGRVFEENIPLKLDKNWVVPRFTDVDSYIPDTWASEAVRNLESSLRLTKHVWRDHSKDVARSGDVVCTRSPVMHTRQAYGVSDTTKVQQSVLENFYVSFKIPDAYQTAPFDKLSRYFLTPAISALGRYIDLSMYQTVMDNDQCVAAAGVDPVDGLYLARCGLNTHYNGGKRFIMIPAMWESDVLKTNHSYVTGPDTSRYLGADLFTDPTMPCGLMFNRDALAFINRPLPIPAHFGNGVKGAVGTHNDISLRVIMNYDIIEQATVVAIHCLAGTAVVDPSQVCKISA